MKFKTGKLCVFAAMAMFMASCTNTIESQQKDNGAMEKKDTVINKYDDATVMKRYEKMGKEEDTGHNNPGRKVVYLTFDDGPSSNTPKVLEILMEKDVKATFFVTGSHQDFVHYIRRAHEQGHAIAAHTYTHNYNIYTTPETYFEDLERIQKVIEEQTGSRTNIVRFPGGSSNTVHHKYTTDSLYMIRLTQMLQDRGYQYVDWNLSSADASGIKVPTETIIKCSCRARENDICLLMHDTFGKETTVAALPAIIDYFKKEGYEFGTITSKDYICHHALKPYRGKNKGSKGIKKDSAATKAGHSGKHNTTVTDKNVADNKYVGSYNRKKVYNRYGQPRRAKNVPVATPASPATKSTKSDQTSSSTSHSSTSTTSSHTSVQSAPAHTSSESPAGSN